MELLKQLVEKFQVLASNVDEDALTTDDPWDTAKVLALEKARYVAKDRSGSLVIGSDTVVAVEQEDGTYLQLAKPTDRSDAARMLRTLSGRCHLVITGVALVAPHWTRVEADETKVCFRTLSEEEIWKYVDSGEPMDKAGAYAIQGGAAGFVERREGSISNVVGLPLGLLGVMLNEFRLEMG